MPLDMRHEARRKKNKRDGTIKRDTIYECSMKIHKQYDNQVFTHPDRIFPYNLMGMRCVDEDSFCHFF